MKAVLGEREVRGYRQVMLDVHVCYLDTRHAALGAEAAGNVALGDGRDSSGEHSGSHADSAEGGGPKSYEQSSAA